MVKQAGRFRLWIEPEFHAARESLPGNVRQRVKRIVNGLSVEPCPADSRVLDVEELGVPKRFGYLDRSPSELL